MTKSIITLGDLPLIGRPAWNRGQVYSLSILHTRILLAILGRVPRWRMSYKKKCPNHDHQGALHEVSKNVTREELTRLEAGHASPDFLIERPSSGISFLLRVGVFLIARCQN